MQQKFVGYRFSSVCITTDSIRKIHKRGSSIGASNDQALISNTTYKIPINHLLLRHKPSTGKVLYIRFSQ